MSKAKPAAQAIGSSLVAVLYHGPAGQTSPSLGVLEPGVNYQVAEDFAAYLCERHPDYWRMPTPVSAATEE